jgi:hypothetical protein
MLSHEERKARARAFWHPQQASLALNSTAYRQANYAKQARNQRKQTVVIMFFISLTIASKWKGNLTKCGFIGMLIYVLMNGMAASSNLQFQYGPTGGLIYGLILGSFYSVIVIWIPVWIIMARRRSKASKMQSLSTAQDLRACDKLNPIDQ